MCGITGIFCRNGRDVQKNILKKMCDTISHRGPDGEGFWVHNNVGLGHRRLAIRELSDLGAQPMPSEDKSVIVSYNGEIYNDAILRSELEKNFGCRFKSHCDTEILPAGYQAWGLGLFEKLEGIFSIAIWDVHKEELILARDPMGVKPLYYYCDDQVVRFGSEIKALLADNEQKRVLSELDVADFMVNGYPSPDRSTYQDIYQVPAGSALVVSSKKQAISKYWEVSRSHSLSDMNAATEQLEDILNEVIESQLISDVTIGALQSAGIDSSLISYSLPQGAEAPLFTVGFNQKSHDETEIASYVAQDLNRKFYKIEANEKNIEDILQDVVHYSDGQLSDSSMIPTYFVCEAISQHAKVALSGDGADEIFGGYETYKATMLAGGVSKFLSASIWNFMGQAVHRLSGVSESRVPLSEKISRLFLGMSNNVPHTGWRRYLQDREMKSVFSKSLYDQYSEKAKGYDEAFTAAQGDVIDKALLSDQTYYLPGDMLIKSDRMSMAHGLEVRVPFLDKRIVEFANRLHPDLLVTMRGETKSILRQVLRRKGAYKNLTSRKKTGFNFPVNAALKKDLFDKAENIFIKNSEVFEPYFNPNEVQKLWQDHKNGKRNYNYALWSFMVFATMKENL